MILFVVAFVLPLWSAAPATAGGVSSWGIVTTSTVSYGGQAETRGQGGLAATWDDGEAANLSAANVHVIVEREQGQYVGGPLGSVYRQPTNRSTEHWNFSRAHATVGADDHGAQLLSIPTNTSARLEATALGASRQRLVPPDRLLAGGGYSDRRQGTSGDSLPAFNYRPGIPLVRHSGMDEASLDGNFSMFVNNATLDVRTGDGRTWSTWSGWREAAAAGPVTEYELRVVTMEVREGTLDVRAADRTVALGRQLDTSVAGSIEIPSATGTIRLGDQELEISGERVEMAGTGRIETVARGDATRPGAGQPSLGTTARGDFEVLSGRPVAGSPASDGWLGTELPPGVVWLVAAAGLVLLLVTLATRTPLARRLPGDLPERLYQRWRRRAICLEDDGCHKAAADLYGRITWVFPDRPRGWYGRSLNLIEAGKPGQAWRVAREAEEALEAVPLDIWELRAAAAYEAGSMEETKRSILALLDRSPRMARDLIDALDLQELANDPEVAKRLGGPRSPWGLDDNV